MRKKGWSKSARRKGYRLEYDTVQHFKKQGIFATRNPAYNQRGDMRPVDVIVCKDPIFVQCKYRKKYLHEEEKERIKVACKSFNATAMLVWRDRGIRKEILN